MERIYSPIIIRNLKNNSIKRMSLDITRINKKIIIKQRTNLSSSYSTKNFRKISNRLHLTPRSFHSDYKIKRDIINLPDYNLLTNQEIKNRLLSAKNEFTNKIYIDLNKLKKNIFKVPNPINIKKNV